MKNILDKIKKENDKMKKIKSRDENKSCRICKGRMGTKGFSDIPRVCKECVKRIYE